MANALELIAKEKIEKTGKLDLGYCGLTELPDELFELIWLEKLIISNRYLDNQQNIWITSQNYGIPNKLKKISPQITKLKNLKEFYCGGYYSEWEIVEISFLGRLTKLQSLSLNSNKIKDILNLKSLSNLQNLDLRSNQIENVSFLKNLHRLKILDLMSNQITEIYLEEMSDLKILDLRTNKIRKIFLKNLKNLKVLNLMSNKLVEISLKDLMSLKDLNLMTNELTKISLLNLNKLEKLNLKSNELISVSLENVNNLQVLDLGNNKLLDVLALENLVKLEILDLRNNNLSDIPTLENLIKLEILDLRNNNLSDISALESLVNLETLDLQNNKLSDISALEYLIKLKTLDLSSNNLSDISALESLVNLEALNLSYNRIRNINKLLPLIGSKKVPLSLAINANSTQKILALYNNPIQKPPLEIVKKGNQAVIDWFAANKKQLEEIKIILIGEPKAGKTSILRRLKDDEYVDGEKQTDGINIESIAFGDNEHFEAQGQLHTLTGHFWDFGGQEIMSATHQFFLTNRSVYVLVLDARIDTQVATQVRKWLQQIQASGGNSPIIVVANQIDVNKGFGFENEVELQQEFPQIKVFIKTSCKTGENLDTLRDLLEQFIPEAELFHTEIDERWIDIKNELQAETKEKYSLNETKFIEICEKHNLHNARQQKDAISFLHDLGLVLHFDDIDTSEYFVLNPYWITYGVYQVLTSTFAGEAKGDIPMRKLKYIINEEADKSKSYETDNFRKIRYSSGEQRFLVDVLHQFKLCFYVADRKRFILPDLLDTKEPQSTTQPIRQATEKIELVYDYSFLPKSFMPYFMVETHKIQVASWRTGCVISQGSCQALIATYNKQLKIIVVGEHRDKGELMSVIRYLIEDINSHLRQSPVLKIPLPDSLGFVRYDILKARQKRGRRYYEIELPTFREFEISALLDGFSMPSTERELYQIQQKLNQLLDVNYTQTAMLKQQEVRIFRQLVEMNTTLDALERKGDIYQHELLDWLNMLDEKQLEISDTFATEIITIIQKGMTDFEANIPQAEDIITAWQSAQNQLKLGVDSKAKLKLSIPFLFLKLEKELTWNGKDWFKAIREDIERGRKGNWSEMFVYK